VDQLVNTVQQFGARVSWRAANGKNKPYEINVTLFDALQGTVDGPDNYPIDRFICAHAIMMSLEGVPAIYIHSLFATNNDYRGVELSNHNRAINRHKWDYDELSEKLSEPDSHHAKVFKRIKDLLAIRIRQPAFHPNATQFTLHLGDQVFGFWRQSPKRDQSIFCIHNISKDTLEIPASAINLISFDRWVDLASDIVLEDIQETIRLQPYGYVWLTNKAF